MQGSEGGQAGGGLWTDAGNKECELLIYGVSPQAAG